MSVERQIEVGKVLTLQDYVRDGLDKERMEMFATLLAETPEGEAGPLPPIEVIENTETGELILADGRHRLEAHRRAGREWMTAVVHPPPTGETPTRHAHVRSIEADAYSPKAHTTAEKRRMVKDMIGYFPAATDAEIARKTGVSKGMVADRRAVLLGDEETPSQRRKSRERLRPVVEGESITDWMYECLVDGDAWLGPEQLEQQGARLAEEMGEELDKMYGDDPETLEEVRGRFGVLVSAWAAPFITGAQ